MPRYRVLFSLALLGPIALSSAVAQPPAQPLPGTPFGEPMGQEGLLPGSFAGELLLQSGGQNADTPTFFILRSPDGKKLWGYSTAKGEWLRATLDDDAKPGDPILGSTVAVVVAGRKVHAFSSIRGEWKSQEVPGKEAIVPIVGRDYVQIGTKESLSIFSGERGNWSTVKFNE